MYKKIIILLFSSILSITANSSERDPEQYYGIDGVNLKNMSASPKNPNFVFVNVFGKFRLVEKKSAVNYIKEKLGYYSNLTGRCKSEKYDFVNPALQSIMIYKTKKVASDACLVTIETKSVIQQCKISKSDREKIKSSKDEIYKRENYEFFSGLTGTESEIMTRSCENVKTKEPDNLIIFEKASK